MVCRILVPRPGIEPTPPALEAWSFSHWDIREVLISLWSCLVSFHFLAFFFSLPNTAPWLQIHASDFRPESYFLIWKRREIIAPAEGWHKGGAWHRQEPTGIRACCPCSLPSKDENKGYHSGDPTPCSQLPPAASSQLLPLHLSVLTVPGPLWVCFWTQGPSGTEQR